MVIVYAALVRLVKRWATLADRFAADSPTAALMAENLRAVADHAPATLYEAMQLNAIFYRLITHVEGENVRSLGRIDKLFLPYVGGEAETRELLRYYLTRFNDKNIGANIPFTLGGADIAGNPAIEALDLMILEEHEKLQIPSPKIQVRVAENTPRSIIEKVCTMMRGGSNSLVFCNDNTVIAGLERLGHKPEDARNYVMIGCYEPSVMGREASCTCNGRISLAKAVECALNGGRDLRDGVQLGPECPEDFASFDALTAEVKRQARHFADGSMARTMAMERLYMQVNPSPMLSGTMACCVERGLDLYEGGADYNFSSINVFGAATAADSLAAVKALVYDEGRLTLAELREILRADWADNETLRLSCKKKLPKYGCGDAETDAIAAELLSDCAAHINRKPNGRRGFWRAGGFSIDWRFDYGHKLAATPDGRHAGESLSKNSGASDGADKNGVTALIHSVCAIDHTALPNGTVLDVTLHPTAVVGVDGLAAMVGLVDTFMREGGFAIQFNVLDPSVLKKAQENPEKYANLQVRLCGWNVYFVNLSRREQDEFIRWSAASSI